MSPPDRSGEKSEAGARILERIRSANAGRDAVPHPGDFGGWRAPDSPADIDPLAGFTTMFEATGGEVINARDLAAAGSWLEALVEACNAGSIAVGRGVPDVVVPPLERVDASGADLAVSSARAGIAETGSLVLDARDGRRTQLLAATHVVLLHVGDIHGSAREAFRDLSGDLPAAIGLHSGPSKSADIGQIMVKGVHGPGRLIAVVIGPGAA